LGRDCRQRTSILSTDGVPISIWILFWYVIIIICMNKRVEELALQCGAWHQVYDQKRFMVDRKFDVEQFAELLVFECIKIAVFKGDATTGKAIKEHFGVE
jgi:hypothetical protein